MSPPPGRPRVCLLRSPSTPDPYVEAFEAAGFEVTCLPVLRFAFLHQEALRERLAHPDRYGGLVLTSPRAVEALDEALCWLPGQSATWEAKPAFVVGPRTEAAVKALGFDPGGAETGHAEALVAHITRAYDDGEAPLLFLCSSRRRDTLPDGLTRAGVPFEEQVVYETHARTDLDFSGQPVPGWLVFFSPSGIEAVQSAKGLDRTAVRVAAIGSTTAAALEAAGWDVEAVAAAPTPEALVEAIRET